MTATTKTPRFPNHMRCVKSSPVHRQVNAMLYHFQGGRFVGATKHVANPTRQDVNQVYESATPTQLAKIQAFRDELDAQGKPVSEWARERGLSYDAVTMVLKGRAKGRRGEAHRVFVAIGLKQPPRTARKSPHLVVQGATA